MSSEPILLYEDSICCISVITLSKGNTCSLFAELKKYKEDKKVIFSLYTGKL